MKYVAGVTAGVWRHANSRSPLSCRTVNLVIEHPSNVRGFDRHESFDALDTWGPYEAFDTHKGFDHRKLTGIYSL